MRFFISRERRLCTAKCVLGAGDILFMYYYYLSVCARVCSVWKMKKIFLFGFGCFFCEMQIRVLKNRDSSSQKQTMRCVDFHNIFQQDVLLIVLNVLPRFETNYSEKNQKQTRCVDFHKIFQDTTTDYCAECSSALRNKWLREESKANEKMFWLS